MGAVSDAQSAATQQTQRAFTVITIIFDFTKDKNGAVTDYART